MSEGNGQMDVQQVEPEVHQIAAARRPTKLEIKRAEIYKERRARAINNGVPEDKVEAHLAAEDYKNLPLDEKFEKFQSLTAQALIGLQQDIMNLQHNDTVIADAMDINLKAMARALEHAGIDKERQQSIMKEVEQEIQRDQQQMKVAREAARKVAREAQEKKTVESEVDKGPADETPIPLPDGATVFGS